MDNVKIEDASTGRVWVFPCNRWLDKTEDDKQIELELCPKTSKKNSGKKNDSSELKNEIAWYVWLALEIGSFLPAEILKYEILIKTSDIRHAGEPRWSLN